MARLNPNPEIEKLKDFRNHGKNWWNSKTVKDYQRYYWHCFRHEWKNKKWNYEFDETLTFSSYNPHHQILWDLW